MSKTVVVPAGLDGNPDPIVTATRTSVLVAVADEVERHQQSGSPLLVAVDGIDGSGKSTFTDELGAVLAARGCHVVRSTIDSFHQPRAARYRRGPTSPVGFYVDSHDLCAVTAQLLQPLAEGVGTYTPAIFDVLLDEPIHVDAVDIVGDEILLFDGIFSQRSELAGYWDLVIFLDAQQRVDLGRLNYVLTDLPTDPVDVVAHVLEWRERMDRYASGQRYYLDLIDPMSAADIVIDNNDLANPRIHDA